MKKTLKSVLAVMLAAIMAFGGFAAFAADEPENTIEWDYYGDTIYLEHAGELTEGKNAVACDTDEGYFYFTFTAENAGFYEISYNYYDMDGYIFVPETYSNGKAYNENIGFWFEHEEDLSSTLYYFEKGEQIIGMFIFYANAESIEITVEYYGENIKSVTTSELIKGEDVYFYSDYDTAYVEIFSDITVTFSNDKAIECSELYCTSDADELIKGENTVTTQICGKNFDFVIDVAFITDYISDIEINNIEDYLFVTEYYNTYDYIYPYGEKATVTFTDGTKKDFVFGEDEITLPNGKEVWPDVYFSVDNGDAKLIVNIAETDLKSYECEKDNAPLGDNWATLVWRNANSLKDMSYYFRRAIATILSCYSLEELAAYGLDDAAYYLSISFYSFTEIFSEAFDLIKFYLA